MEDHAAEPADGELAPAEPAAVAASVPVMAAAAVAGGGRKRGARGVCGRSSRRSSCF
jgi:hypothetical protein